MAPKAVILPNTLSAPRGLGVAQEAVVRFQQGGNADAAQVRPVYLRKSQPEQARARITREGSPA